MQQKNALFDKNDTKAIKGIAIIMMLFHHLAGFPERFPVGFEEFISKWQKLIDDGYLQTFAFNAKFCVSIFFFLGGYGMYKRWEKGKFSLSDSIISLIKRFWKIFIIFTPIAFIFFKRTGEGTNYLCSRYVIEKWSDFITNVLGNFILLNNSINLEWWFLPYYICALMLGAFYCDKTKKTNNFLNEIFIVFGLDILIRSIFPNIPAINGFSGLYDSVYYYYFMKITENAPIFFAGIIFAKYNGICRIKNELYKIPCRTVISILGIFAIIWSRCYIKGEALDIVYSVLFTSFCSVIFDSLKVLKSIFQYLGKHSTNIWLIHSFYCYYFLEATKLVYSTRNVWINLLILLLMSLVSSILVDLFYNLITKLYSKVKNWVKDDKLNNSHFTEKEKKPEETPTC